MSTSSNLAINIGSIKYNPLYNGLHWSLYAHHILSLHAHDIFLLFPSAAARSYYRLTDAALNHVFTEEQWIPGRLCLRLWRQVGFFSRGCCWFFTTNYYFVFSLVYRQNSDNSVPNSCRSYTSLRRNLHVLISSTCSCRVVGSRLTLPW